MLYQLCDSLNAAALDQPPNFEEDDDSDDAVSFRETPAVIRIAAHAGVLLMDKYMNLTWDCELYVVSIGKLNKFIYFLIELKKIQLCVQIASFHGSKTMDSQLQK